MTNFALNDRVRTLLPNRTIRQRHLPIGTFLLAVNHFIRPKTYPSKEGRRTVLVKPVLLTSVICLLLSKPLAHGEEYGSFYFAGFSQHFKSNSETHNGNMSYLGYSREFVSDNWQFDTGASTYIDSYNKRSYGIFSDISHKHYVYGYFRPIVSLNCSYKGAGYNSQEMTLLCFPLLKLRIGGQEGLFASIAPVPPIGTLTNGLIAMELGYKW